MAREAGVPPDIGGDGVLGRVIGGSVGLALFVLAWFWIAGRWNWVQGWVLLLAFVAYVAVLVWQVGRSDPELVRERQQEAENVEPWDRCVIRVYTTLMGVLLVVAALDSGRFGWSAVPMGVQLLGWALLCAAAMVIWHVMMVNAYLSSWARLQEDRGQVVVGEGLYGRIRHPMYLGIIVAFLGLPLASGSWWALIPGSMVGGVFVYRTLREDGMLMAGLPGYEEYASEVRYRLLPGIW